MTDRDYTDRDSRTALVEALWGLGDEYRKHETREAALLSGLCLLALLARTTALRGKPHMASRLAYWRDYFVNRDYTSTNIAKLKSHSLLEQIKSFSNIVMQNENRNPESDIGLVLTYSIAVEHASQKAPAWWEQQELLISKLDHDDPRICELATELVFKSWRTALSSRARNLYESGPYPQSLGNLLTRLLSPERNEVLYDPTVGTGSLLFYLSQRHGAANHDFCGQDIDESLAGFAEFVIGLNGGNARFPSMNVFSESGLPVDTRESLPDVVLLDPPWGRRLQPEQEAIVIHQSDLLCDTDIRSVSSEMAYLVHGIEHCNKQRGRVAALLPSGVAFRQGSDQLMRKLLTERSWIPLCAVISLPPMMAYTLAAPVLLIFDARRGAGKVLFVDATDKRKLEDYELRHDSINQIVRYYQESREQEGISKWVTRKELALMNYTWEVKRYILPSGECEGPTVDEIRERVSTVELQLQENQRRLEELMSRLSFWADEPQRG